MAKNKKVKEEVSYDGKVVNEEISKKDVSNENRQLYWFFGIAIFVFLLFLGTYYYYETYIKITPEGYRLKGHFEYAGIEWQIEDYTDFIAYHGRFPSFMNENNTHNIYLRVDPRQNNVSTSGDFLNFKYGGYISTSPEVDNCTGDMVGDILTLTSFLKYGVGMSSIELGTTDQAVAQKTNRTQVNCSLKNRGVILIQQGNESSVVQSDKNEFCYIITVKDCNDIAPVEKFMLEVLKQKSEE